MASSTAYAFIYEISVLRRWNGQLGAYQYFVGLSDFHDRSNPINKVQLKDFSEILDRCGSHSLKVGSEDISSPNNGRNAKCGRFYVRARGGVLSGFGLQCKKRNLDVSNMEYRYCRVAALGPVLNNASNDMSRFPSVKNTRVIAIIREIEEMFREIFLYRDGSLLTEFYNACIERVKRRMYELKLHTHSILMVSDYLDLISTVENRVDVLKKLLTFDSILVDLKLLHDVLNSYNKTSYLAVAGGAHITRVSKLLSKLGWQWVYTTTPTFVKEKNMSKCLGGHIIEGTFCKKPKPIDIRLIGNYL